MRSDSSLSESENSFVSAESENASSQSALHRVQSSSSHKGSEASATSSASSTQPTPLARNYIAVSPSVSRRPATATSSGSYFTLQPGTPGSEPRSPPNRRPPASRSSHGIETRSGPPPALSTRKSYNSEIPLGPLASADQPDDSPHQFETNGSIDSILSPNQRSLGTVQKSRRDAGRRPKSMDETIAPAVEASYTEDDQDATIRANERNFRINRSRSKSTQNRQSEDLFLNLAGDVTDSMSERRRVS